MSIATRQRPSFIPATFPDGSPTVIEVQRAETQAKLCRLCRLQGSGRRRGALRDEVISDYMPYARFLARRYLKHGESGRDLVQAAYVGLVKAVDNYDPAFDTTFLTYATPMITGEMKRHFRDTTWDVHVPRRMQELSAQLRTGTAELSQKLRRSPTVPELAEHLHASQEDVVNAYEATRAYSSTSLDKPLGTAEDGGAVLGDVIGAEDPAIDAVVDREALKEALKHLSQRDKRILLMRFFRNMSQAEIGEEIGVSQMQVSRLLTQITARLRGLMDAR